MTRGFRRILAAGTGVLLAVVLLLLALAVWLLLTAPQPRDAPDWRLGPALPLAHGELATTVGQRPVECEMAPCDTATALVVLGGIAGTGEVVDRVHWYLPQAGHWVQGSTLPAPRHHTAAATLDGAVYASGGAQTLDRPWQATASFWRLEPDKHEWEVLPDMPAPRWGHRMVALDGRLYVVGGQGEGRGVLIYEPGQGWSRGAEMPVPRDHLSVVVVDDLIWAIGGRAPESLARVDIYDPARDQWRDGPDLPAVTSGAAEGVIDGHILVLGGEEPALRGGHIIDRHWVLDARADAPHWRPAPPPPLPVHGADGAVLDGQMVIAGGAARHGLLSVLGWTDLLQVLELEPPFE